MAILIDTSFLLAALHVEDSKHIQARNALQSLKGDKIRFVPAPVIYELFYMLTDRVSYERAIQAIELVRTKGFIIEAVIDADHQRMIEIMRQYASAAFDYADVSIMAISERLNIQQIYTFDQRDFGIFRPRHCNFLQILPK